MEPQVTKIIQHTLIKMLSVLTIFSEVSTLKAQRQKLNKFFTNVKKPVSSRVRAKLFEAVG